MLVHEEILHQILAIIPVNINALNMGMGYGWISPTLETLSHPDSVIPLTTAESSLIACLQEIGRIAGSILATILLDSIGRRRSLIIAGSIFFIQWIIVWLTKSVWVICIVRLMCGLGMGLQDTSSSIYIAENSSSSIRGIFGSILVSFFYLGMLVEFLFTNYFSYYDVALANSIVGGVSLVTTFLLKEPAQHLIMKGKLEQAKKNFIWLKGTNENDTQVQQEFTSLQEAICKERNRRKSLAKLLSTPFIYKIIAIVFIHYTLTQATGFSAVNSYATLSFSNSGFFNRKELTVLLGVMQLVAVSLSSLLIERFARKTIMRSMFGLAGFVHLCSAVLFYTQQYAYQIPNFPLYIFTSISSFSVIYAVGILPTLSLMRGELFPQSIKAVGGCICIIGNSLVGIFVNSMYLRVGQKYGLFVNYLFFSVCSFVTVLYVHFVLPETRGKSLIEIQRCIDKKTDESTKNNRSCETA